MNLDLQRVQLENSPLPQATPDGFSLSFRCTLALDDSSATTTALVVKLPARMGPWFTRALTLPPAVMPGGLNPEEIQPFFEEASNVLRILPPSTTTATTTDANDDPLHDSVGRIHIHRLVRVEADPYPMLFYEAYDDDVHHLRLKQPEQEQEWTLAALQLISAFDYMQARGLVLTPLGIDNVVRRRTEHYYHHLHPTNNSDKKTQGWNYMLTGFARCGACDPHDRTAGNEAMLTGMRQLATVLLDGITTNSVCLHPQYKSALNGTISLQTPEKCLLCFQSLRKRLTRRVLASLKH